MRTALLVPGSWLAVKERAGITPFQAGQTFLCLTSKGNSTKFTLERAQTRENCTMLKLTLTPSLEPSTSCDPFTPPALATEGPNLS